MAEYLVLNVTLLNSDDEPGTFEVFYYEHFKVLNEDLFRESSPKSVKVAGYMSDVFETLPGIYEMVLSEGREKVISVEFIGPVDMWWEEECQCH